MLTSGLPWSGRESRYNAKVHPHLPKLSTLLAGLSQRSPIKPAVVIITAAPSANRHGWHDGWIRWEDFVAEGRERKLGRTSDGEIEWRRQSFDWPLWILFSSGTTGA